MSELPQASVEVQPLGPPRLHWWQWMAVVLSSLTFVMVATLGPWVWVKQITTQNKQLSNQNAQTASIKTLLLNTNTVVNYIHQIQTGRQSTASREATAWFFGEFRAICAAQRGCQDAPLPPGLAKLLGQK